METETISCPTCYARVLPNHLEKHMKWHEKLENRLSNAASSADPRLFNPDGRY